MSTASTVTALRHQHHVQLPGRYYKPSTCKDVVQTLHSDLPSSYLSHHQVAVSAVALGYVLHRFTLQDEIGLTYCTIQKNDQNKTAVAVNHLKIDYTVEVTIAENIADATPFLLSQSTSGNEDLRGQNSTLFTNVGFCAIPHDENPQTISEHVNKYDIFLTLHVDEDNGASCSFQYSSKALDDIVATSIFETFLRVVEQCAPGETSKNLSQLNLTNKTPPYLSKLNSNKAEYSSEKTVHECFDDIALRYPDRVALEDHEWKQLSYKQLQEVSQQMSSLFIGAGVKPGESIGILMLRSIPCMASVIATLRMGCCYVHLNTCLPNERLKYQADMCSITHFICDENGAECLLMDNLFPDAEEDDIERYQGVRMFNINRESTDESDFKHEPFHLSPSSLAYTMFTSGTTGLPKGVEISHKNIVNFATNFNEIDHSKETGMLQSPLNFDATTFEIWSILLNGGKLVIAPPVRISTQDIVGFILEHNITQVFLTTGLFHVIVSHHCEELKRLRHVVVCGDIMVPERARHAVKNLPTTFVYNNYGPTETTAFCTLYKIPREFADSTSGFVPIGTPLKNQRLYFLDSSRNPVPLGMPGDLYIGGDGVGIGYKTNGSGSFMPAPEWIRREFGECGLVYRSGDTARCIPDLCDLTKLNVQFLGRIDTQTKIAGSRVELKECESWILKHPSVKNACVVATGDCADNRRLEAYVVLDKSIPVNELQTFSAKHLPNYSVPTVWHSVDCVPLNNNGKVAYRDLSKLNDMSSLVAFKREYSTAKQSLSKIEGEEKSTLAKIWSDELSLPIQDIDDTADYYRLGGTSLLALHILARIDKELNRKISDPEIFPLYSSFGKFAEKILAFSVSDVSKSIPGVDLPDGMDSTRLSWQQQEFYEIDKSKQESYAHKIYATVKFQSRLQPERLEKAINRNIRKHSSLSTLFVEKDGKPMKVKSTLLCRIKLAKRKLNSSTQGDIISAIQAESDDIKLDIKRGPLMSCTLFEVGETSILHIVAHHIAVDDFSLWMFIKQVLKSYQNQNGEDVDDIDGYDGYDIFIDNQLSLSVSSLKKAELHWSSKVEPLTANPFRMVEATTRRTFADHKLSALELQFGKSDVTALSREHGVSHVCVLLSAYYLALCDASQCNDISITSPFANRTADTMHMVGTTANRVILRISLGGETVTPSQIIQSVRREISTAMKYQDVPVRCLVPNVGFNFFSTENICLDLDGEAVHIPVCNAPSDQYMWMELVEMKDSFCGNIQYRKNVLPGRTVQTVKERFLFRLSSLRKELSIVLPNVQPGDQETNGVSLANDIEHVLLQDKKVVSCYAKEMSSNGKVKWCFYLKAFANVQFQDLRKRCANRLVGFGFSRALITLVKDIPRDSAGAVDEEKLSKCLIIDETMCSKVCDKLQNVYSSADIHVECITKPQDSYPYGHIDLGSSKKHSDVAKFDNVVPTETLDDKQNVDLLISNSAAETEYQSIAEPINPRSLPKHLTMADALMNTADEFPTKGIFFISKSSSQILTYSNLLTEALKVSNGLRKSGIKAGSFVILHDDSTRQMLPVWWGAVLVGAVPVFVSTSTTYQEITGVTDKLHHVWTLLKHPVIVCTSKQVNNVQSLELLYRLFKAEVIASEYLVSHEPLSMEDIHKAKPEDLLFLQLSSGSTGAPKCIQESNYSVIHHILLSSEANNYSAEDRTLNWLAMDHVVPILTFHLKDTYLGCTQYIVDRHIVLSDPIQWLVLMSKYKITRSWSPNFGYAAVVHQLSQLAHVQSSQLPHIDLSLVKTLLNAGEMVTQKTVSDFTRHTQQFNLSPSSMQPSFGMAETATCFTYPVGVNYLDSSEWYHSYADNCFVDLGPPMKNVHIRICDPSTGDVLPDGEIGELEIQGPVLTTGYLFNDKASEQLFHDDYLRSGDCALMKNGHLIMTGRIKEQITVRGNKLFCHEVEEAIVTVPGVKPTFVACCGSTSANKGTEGLIVFICIAGSATAKPDRIVRDVKLFVNRRFSVLPDDIVILSERNFLKTTSGKIQRLAMKDLFEKGKLKSVQDSSNTLHILNRVLEPAQLRASTRAKLANHSVILVVRKHGHPLSNSVIDQLVREGFNVCVINVLTSSAQEPESLHGAAHLFEVVENGSITFESTLEKVLKYTGYIDFSVNFLGHNADSNMGCSSDIVSSSTGSLPLFNLLSAILKMYKDPIKFVNISVLSRNPYRVFSSVLLPILSKENDNLTTVDVHVPLEIDNNIYLAGAIVEEIFSSDKEDIILYQDGRRMVQRFEKSRPRDDTRKTSLKKNGVYIVTGGFSDVSKKLIRFLHLKYQNKLIVVGRRQLSNTEVCKAYQNCLEEGIDVVYVSGDAGCEDTSHRILHAAQSKWPDDFQIDGAFHLACSYEEDDIANLSPDTINALVRGKVVGTKLLYEFLKKQDTASLLVLFSSVYSGLPLKKLFTYSVANAFMSSFSDWAQSEESNVSVTCFNWSLWKDLGVSKDHPVNERAKHLGLQRIDSEQGFKIMDEYLGSLSPLFVGLDPNGSLAKTAMVSTTYSDLSNVALKVKIVIPTGSEMPKTSNVKVQLKAMKCLDAVGNPLNFENMVVEISSQSQKTNEDVNPESSRLRNLITKEWCSVLNISEDQLLSENFFEMGGESVDIPVLMARLRIMLDQDIDQVIYQHPTISSLTEYLVMSADSNSVNQTSPQATWISTHPADQTPGQGKVILFCFPYIGSSYGCFSNWTFPDIDVWFTIYPYRPRTWEELIHMLSIGILDITAKAPDTQFVLFGHSFAALLVYEVYHYLSKQHRLPSMVVVSGMHSPLRMEVRRPSVKKWNQDVDTDEKFLKAMRKAGFEIDQVLLERASINSASDEVIGQIRYLFKLYEIYHPEPKKPPIDVPLTVFGSREDSFVTLKELRKWQEVCDKPVTLVDFPGGHFFLYYQNSRVLAKLVNCIFDTLDV